jgi:lipopolysaccharide transport system permease protein
MFDAQQGATLTQPDDVLAHPRRHLVIQPRGFLSGVNLVELWQYRDLLRSFASRDVRLRYRQTALGVIWVVLQPLLAAGVFAFVFGRVAHLPSQDVPYVVFAYAGLLAWTPFSNVLTRASTVLLGASGMVSKVYFPKLLLPVSVIGSSALDFVVAAAVLLLLLPIYSIPLTWQLLALPFFVFITMCLALGAGFITSALTVRYRDVGYIVPLLLQLLLFISPVAYSLDAVPQQYRWVVAANPLTGALEASRWAALGLHNLDVGALVYSTVCAAVLVSLGAFVFTSLERDFADVI